MFKKFTFVFLFFIGFQGFSQEEVFYVDENYLEDQLYVGLTYNILNNKPSGFNQNGLSGGLLLGFIKDLPINKKRNRAFGIGLGYAYNAYIQNLKISESGNVTAYNILADSDFNNNRLSTHTLEVPFEFRWRTSTPTDYTFWRFYTGIKFGYVFGNTARFSDTSGTTIAKGIDQINKLQYGLTLSTGHGSFNLNVYYGLNSLFKNAEVNKESIDLKQLNVGLIFYIM